MTEANTATEETLAQDLGKMWNPSAVQEGEEAPPHYEFDLGFQSKIAAMVIRDTPFNDQTNGLIIPDYFENLAEATLVHIALTYYEEYRKCPDLKILVKLVQEGIEKKRIRGDVKSTIIQSIRNLYKEDISDRKYVVECVAEFAKHQAVERAVLDTVTLLQGRQFDKIEKAWRDALMVGADDAPEYDYFGEIGSRTKQRLELLAGNTAPTGITTGFSRLDGLLFHSGWGREELSVWMGGAKAGKSTFLINSGIFAAMAGYNVLHVTLEMSKEIAAMRADAHIANSLTKDVLKSPHSVQKAVEDFWNARKMGEYKILEFPSGTWRPSDFRRVIERYRSNGIIFDLVVIDYLDIMVPNFRTDSVTENSKSIWVDCRGIAQVEGFALLSATQTNREGFKASVAKAEHAADDFNKIRIADLVISINRTEDEVRRNEARLYFAASRNQGTGFSVHIKQDLERMKSITDIVGID